MSDDDDPQAFFESVRHSIAVHGAPDAVDTDEPSHDPEDDFPPFHPAWWR
jgi:hypothetical protein